jgi:alcohol dehydrogenase class IV
MVNAFEFATSGRILFGPGRARELPALAREFGTRALVITGSNPQRFQALLDSLREQQISWKTFSVRGEPTVADAAGGAELARSAECEVIIAIGGGSVIDAAKAVAALATNRRDVLDYLEVIGKAQPLTENPLPVIAVPTTAGTGAEVTRNAVLQSPEHRVKVSLRSPRMLPRVALVDPDLTLDLPPAITANTGMDALTQLIEPFVSRRANPITDALCRDGIPRVARSLGRAFRDGGDSAARNDMALASLFGGLALANAALGAVHGFAGPIGGMFPAPHGAVCAALLGDVMEANIAAATEQNATEVVSRYREVAQMLTENAEPSAGVAWIRALCQDLKIPRLAHFGIQRGDLSAIAGKAAASSSMKGNPVTFSEPQLAAVLERAL